MNKYRKKLIKKIDNDINDILIEDRIFLMNMIALKIGTDDLYQEGTGTRILYKKMPDDLLKDISKFIKKAKRKTEIKF